MATRDRLLSRLGQLQGDSGAASIPHFPCAVGRRTARQKAHDGGLLRRVEAVMVAFCRDMAVAARRRMVVVVVAAVKMPVGRTPTTWCNFGSHRILIHRCSALLGNVWIPATMVATRPLSLEPPFPRTAVQYGKVSNLNRGTSFFPVPSGPHHVDRQRSN